MVTIPIQFCYNEYFLLQNVLTEIVINENKFKYYATFHLQNQKGNYNLV